MTEPINPLWLTIALGELGVREYTPRRPGPNGEQSNPRIEQYQAVAGGQRDDAIAWCASGLSWALHQAGLPHLGTGARAYAKYGDRSAFRRGAIMPMRRGEDHGHVTLAYDLGPCSLYYVHTDGTQWAATAGEGQFIGYGANQHDMWCFAAYDLDRLIAGPRWPTPGMLVRAGLDAAGARAP